MSFLADVRIALRTLLRAPGFFGMASGVLALGIAAVVVMFGFLRVTMTPPPLDRVDRVFSLLVRDARRGGVLAYSVAQGAREIAIRRALGAPGALLVMAVMARSGWQLVLGLALGMVLAPGMGALIGSVVGQPEPALRVYLGVAAVLSATLLVSVLVPLRRALSLEPSAALRHT